jgi:WD40 repeat protein
MGHTDSVNCLLLLSEYELLCGSDDRAIKIWNITIGKTLNDCESSIRSLVRFPIKDLIISTSDDCFIRIRSLKLSEQFVNTIHAHTEPLFSLLALKTGYLATSSCDKTINIWDINKGLSISTLLGHTDQVWSLAELTSGKLISISCDKTIKIWNAYKG